MGMSRGENVGLRSELGKIGEHKLGYISFVTIGSRVVKGKNSESNQSDRLSKEFYDYSIIHINN